MIYQLILFKKKIFFPNPDFIMKGTHYKTAPYSLMRLLVLKIL